MAVLFGLLLAAGNLAQSASTGTVAAAVGGQFEGTETRFGVPGGTLFGIAATGSADGAANASYDSFSSLGGGVLLAAMILGEIAPGGVGSGLYGLIMIVLVAVFVGGLMVGRYLPIILVLALAGLLVTQKPVAITAGTLQPSGPTFAILTTVTALVLPLLSFLPALSLGPLADGTGS